MSELLSGRAAIVTGGARGIGAAIARALVDNGAAVVVADNGAAIDGTGPDPEVAMAYAAELGPRALAFSQDMAGPEAARAAVALAQERFGGIDIVVNNAAILRDSFVFRGAAEDWDAVIRTNLSAAYYLINAATQVMRDQAKAGRGAETGSAYRWGRIVNLVSTAAWYGNFGQAPYASAKGGLAALTRITALDMARSNVTANAVAPFAHSRVTDMIRPANDAQAAYKERALKIPPSHVANLVVYLCSEAAQGVTGQFIGVRGRDVFLFSQPRPVATVTAPGAEWDPGELARAVEENFADKFADLVTDLEAFNTDPAL